MAIFHCYVNSPEGIFHRKSSGISPLFGDSHFLVTTRLSQAFFEVNMLGASMAAWWMDVDGKPHFNHGFLLEYCKKTTCCEVCRVFWSLVLQSKKKNGHGKRLQSHELSAGKTMVDDGWWSWIHHFHCEVSVFPINGLVVFQPEMMIVHWNEKHHETTQTCPKVAPSRPIFCKQTRAKWQNNSSTFEPLKIPLSHLMKY